MTRVEHLRRHPFLACEEEWIRVRAYFRHLNDPAASPDANWLAAEAELLEEIARGVFVWPTNDLMLDDFYDPPVGFRVRIGEAGAKRYVGSCAPRVCVWCTRRVPEATFRTDAHLISETFGNRSLFTLEECDECNYRHGTQLEDHLAKMLLDIRVFAQMRTKSGGVAKTKFGQGPAWVGGTPRTVFPTGRLTPPGTGNPPGIG